jgi:uncharacterized heparinase superfamily protein
MTAAPIRRVPARLRRLLAGLYYRSPLHAMTLGGPPPGPVRPPEFDTTRGGAGRGRALAAGRFVLAGRKVEGGQEIWAAADAPGPWADAFHGFGWLADLAAAEERDATIAARHMTADWLGRYGLWHPVAWAPAATARRLESWLRWRSLLVGQEGDAETAALDRAFARQARHLARTGPADSAGPERVQVARSLILAGIAMGLDDRLMARGADLLDEEIAAQILPDGATADRRPESLADLLEALVGLRAALAAGGRRPSDAMVSAIDRLAPALRFLRHADGALAVFHGGGEGEPRRIEALLARCSASGTIAPSLPHGGYQRLAAGDTVLLVDAAAPPPPGRDRTAHAAPLALEMSAGRERMLVNCGADPEAGPAWRTAQRATAAHSTLVLDDTNAVAVIDGGGLAGRPEVTCRREIGQHGEILLQLSHDGYRPSLGVVHKRRVYLSAEGTDLRVEERISGSGEHAATLRLHLDPAVRTSLLADGEGALLRLPSGQGWRLRFAGGRPRIESSVYFGAGAPPRKTEQIVVEARMSQAGPPLRWALQRIDAGGPPPRGSKNRS